MTYNFLYNIHSTDPKVSSYHLLSSSESRYKEPIWNGAKYVIIPPRLNALGERLANGLREAYDTVALKEVRPVVERGD